MTLEEQFHEDVMATVKACRALRYNPTYFLQMVEAHGAVNAAKTLVGSGDFQSGLITLWEKGRLDLSMENRILNPKFTDLFTEDERAAAQKRLADLSYAPVW